MDFCLDDLYAARRAFMERLAVDKRRSDCEAGFMQRNDKVAIYAIERLVPSAVMSVPDRVDRVSFGKVKCPTCGSVLPLEASVLHPLFCQGCGQRLSWKVSEE